MPQTHKISPQNISIDTLADIAKNNGAIVLSAESKKRIKKCRAFLDQKIADGGTFYGINTGFGSLHDVRVSSGDLDQLQYNLVVSHACGTGDLIPEQIAKLMLLLKIQSLSYGHSGIRLETVERLIAMYNHNVIPVIYEMGSLGASGDLAPLAHMSLPLLGLGDVYFNHKKTSAGRVLKKLNWKPLVLKSKEGLALLNGTQFMSAFGVWLLHKAKNLSNLADLVASIAVDAFDCKPEPFHHLIHDVRPHKGQIETARQINKFLKGSSILKQHKVQVQDPYSFRCVPQVHGASKDVIRQVEETFTTEINSVTDNPNIFPDEDLILSGGNFHGQPLAMALDYLAIALCELGSISERRTYFLVSGYRDLPPFLIKDAGVNSGMMIPQYTAASMVSQNKQLATPASVDSIDSSNRQEDHVSMGANAATKCWRIYQNLERIIAIELLAAAQAIEFRRPMKSSKLIEGVMKKYRKQVSFLTTDRPLYQDIQKSVAFIQTLEI